MASAHRSLGGGPSSHPRSLFRNERIELFHDEGEFAVAAPSFVRSKGRPIVVNRSVALPCPIYAAVLAAALAPSLQSVNHAWRALITRRRRWAPGAGVIPMLHEWRLHREAVAQQLKFHRRAHPATEIQPCDANDENRERLEEDRPTTLLDSRLKADGFQMRRERELVGARFVLSHW